VKAHVSDYLEVMQYVYYDACMKCSADVLDLRDLETIKSRVEQEGLSFLTITLPRFCKAFERSLTNGCIDSACFSGFKTIKHGAIPAFLQGMLSHLFDSRTGEVISYEPPFDRNNSNEGLAIGDASTIVEAVRQVCRVFSKIQLPCTSERTRKALDSFCDIEQDLQHFTPSGSDISDFLEVSDTLWGNLVGDFSLDQVTPKHGPGATADRISGNQKYVWRRWHDRLEPYFPLVHNGYPLGIDEHSEELEIVTIVPETDEQPVRVITVPKTLRSPRVIAIEPVCMQFVQQGIRSFLYERIESYWLTRKRINFRDQSINQRKAITASRTGRFATIDLSEASDRVPWLLAKEMFRLNPVLQGAIEACRSTRAHLPDGRIIDPLLKFASMGSALCFPVEAMYFYTIIVLALLKSSNLSCTPRNIFKVSREVYVYGDDLIVPSANADAVVENLQKYNCKVNADKSFWTGKFRESCGIDAYAGYEVTPTYVRQPPPNNRQQHGALISWTASANLFYMKGYWRTAQFLLSKVERYLGSLPYTRLTSPVLGRYSFLGYESAERWNSELQRLEVRGWKPSPVYRSDELDGWAAGMKCFQRLDGNASLGTYYTQDGWFALNSALEKGRSFEEPSPSDPLHLQRSALHGAVTLKRRWALAH